MSRKHRLAHQHPNGANYVYGNPIPPGDRNNEIEADVRGRSLSVRQGLFDTRKHNRVADALIGAFLSPTRPLVLVLNEFIGPQTRYKGGYNLSRSPGGRMALIFLFS